MMIFDWSAGPGVAAGAKRRLRAFVPLCLCALVPLCLCAFFPVSLSAGTREAAQRVQEGIAAYRAGNYQQAAAAFAEADIARPDDPRIAFDRATALAAQGQTDEAVGLFQKAALGSTPGLAARARYNLGCLAAAQARSVFGEHPEEAAPEVRRDGLERLAQAVGHFRDCLQAEPEHADARHNLEMIRLWIKHMEALWRDRDRQKQRQEMDLLAFLQMLDQRQRALRAAGKELARQSDSPQRRQAIAETESAQRDLAQEIPVLKEKIESAASQSAASGAPGGATPAKPQLSPEAQKAVEALQGVADAAGQAMLAAAGRLRAAQPGDAAGPQTEAVDKLDEVYRAVAPYENVVQRALQTQNALVDQTVAVVERPEEAKDVDLGESAWAQEFVGRWSELLPARAPQGLKDLEAAQAEPSAAPPAQGPQQAPADPEAEKKQREGLRRSMQLAITLAPKVHELSLEAVKELTDQKPAAALPKQQEALKLLKEIAEPLPKQPQPQEQQPKKDDQQKQEQKPQPQPSDQPQQDQPQQQQPQQPQPKPGELSKQQAEAVLRQAQQRQQQRQQMDKQLQNYLYRPGPVEKDW